MSEKDRRRVKQKGELDRGVKKVRVVSKKPSSQIDAEESEKDKKE